MRSATTERRRRPVQERARARREQLLDAAARLLAREGLVHVTTNALAREAGTSIGTVYDYFPDKEAVFAALLERYRVRLGKALGEALARSLADGWEAASAAGVDAFARFYREEPGYRELWLGGQLITELRAAGAVWGDHFTAVLAGSVAALGVELAPAQAERIARVAVHMVSALITAALAGPSEETEALVAETRRALRAYLGLYLPPTGERRR